MAFGLLTVASPILLASCQEQGPSAPEPLGISAAKNGNGGGGGGPTVAGANPSEVPRGLTVDLEVTGTLFDDGSTVDLLIDGASTGKVRTNSTTFDTPERLIANVTVDADAELVLYDVRVTTSRKKKGIGADLVDVIEGPCDENPNQGNCPPVLNDPVPFEITFADNDVTTREDLLGSDGEAPGFCSSGASCYEDGQEDVAAHFSGNGNLMFDVRSTARTVFIDAAAPEGDTGPFTGLAVTRIYTNNPDVDLRTLTPDEQNSPTTARLIVEWQDSKSNDKGDLRFGVDCTGDSFGEPDPDHEARGTRVSVSRAGDIWTITPLSDAFLCRFEGRGKKRTALESVLSGVSGVSFTMWMEKI
jgi:hypothetical protein